MWWLGADSQPDAWAAIVKAHGANAEVTLLDRLRKLMDDQGTLHVLRVGLEMMGLKGPLKLAQFRPALAMNLICRPATPPTACAWCASAHQPRRHHRPGAVLNGIPVATAELKSEFTQGINEAVDHTSSTASQTQGQGLCRAVAGLPRGHWSTLPSPTAR